MNASRLLLVSVGLLLLAGMALAERKSLELDNKYFTLEKGPFIEGFGEFLRAKMKGRKAGKFWSGGPTDVYLLPGQTFELDGWITGTYTRKGEKSAVLRLTPDAESLQKMAQGYETHLFRLFRLFTGQEFYFQLDLVKQKLKMVVREGDDGKLSAKIKFKYKVRGTYSSDEEVPGTDKVKAVEKIVKSGEGTDRIW